MSRLRIAILGASPCGQCTSACCRQNGHAYAALLQGEEVRRFAPYATHARIDAGDGRVVVERVLPYVDGRCVFLGEDGDCLVYDDRPAACRAFECVRHFNREGVARHDVFLRRNPRVLALLERM
jgi:Fe-S-cluster containining protein